MLEAEKIEQWRGEPVVDREGEKVGKLDDVFMEVGSGDPGVAAINTGFLGRKTLLAPLQGATLSRESLRLAIGKDQLDGAPEASDDGQLDRNGEVALFGHYDLDPPSDRDGDPDGSRYESKAAREDKSERAAELRAEAAELKGEAKDRDAEASEAASEADEARDQRTSAERERDEKAEKADELRREADRLEN
jgi:hypothetical protein